MLLIKALIQFVYLELFLPYNTFDFDVKARVF